MDRRRLFICLTSVLFIGFFVLIPFHYKGDSSNGFAFGIRSDQVSQNVAINSTSVVSIRKKSWSLLQYQQQRKNILNDDHTYCIKPAPFLGPYPFVNASLNPCWHRKADDKLQCIPGLYLVGFSKCGTSDLFVRIVKHPQVLKANKKEIHWFDYQRYFAGQDSIDAYTSNFNKPTRRIEEDITSQGYSDKITVDFTPSYAWNSLYWRCYQGNQGFDAPRYTNADVIYHLCPKAKIIISLRNPVARLYSRFMTWKGKDVDPAYAKPTATSFHSLVTRALPLYQACFRNWSPRSCAYNGTLYALSRLRLLEGMYSIFLEDWLRVFPKHQIFFVRFEDYVQDTPNHLKRIFRFLEIDPLTEAQLKATLESGVRNKGKYYNAGPMLNKTRILLESFYRPFLTPIPKLAGNKDLVWF